jgi:glutamate-1-semialdehyde 2,1-aminomutase
MATVAPEGPVYQAGTLSGNPVAMAAGLATLEEIAKPGVIEELTARTRALTDGIEEVMKKSDEPVSIKSFGSLLGIFMLPEPPRSYEEAGKADTDRYGRFFHALLKKGVYLAPSAFEAAFMSTAHSYDDIDKTVQAVSEALAESR